MHRGNCHTASAGNRLGERSATVVDQGLRLVRRPLAGDDRQDQAVLRIQGHMVPVVALLVIVAWLSLSPARHPKKGA